MNLNNKQSTLFLNKFSNEYFEDTKNVRNFFADYLLSIFSKKDLIKFDVAEWGIGGGHNLHLLSHYVNKVHAYDGSNEGIKSFKHSYEVKSNSEMFYAKLVNLAEPFETPIKYDLIIYGFFPYVLNDDELQQTKLNLLKALKPNGYVVVFDFLARDNKINTYRGDDIVKTYKRNLKYWLNYFDDFDLIDYRLFDSNKNMEYKFQDTFKIDTNIPMDDNFWTFISCFRKIDENNS